MHAGTQSTGNPQHVSRRNKRSTVKTGPSLDELAGTAGPYGIQFTLGEGDEEVEEQVQFAETHPLFCEMEELRPAKADGSLEWKETARWIKFEEDVEEGGNRWSKPFVATLALHSLMELKSYISHGAVILDADVPALPLLCDLIIDEWINKGILQDYHRDQVRDLLLRRHRHQFEGADHKASYALRQLSGLGRSISQGIFSMAHAPDTVTENPPSNVVAGQQLHKADKPRGTKRSQTHVPNVMSAASILSSEGSEGILSRNASRANLHFSRKLALDAESATILVGEVEFVTRPVCAFVRILNHVCLGNLTEVNVPTRFIFLLLGPRGNAAKYHEIGRAMGVCCSDEIFQSCLYKAKSRKDVVDGLEAFLNEVTILPPGEWDPQNTRKKSPDESTTISFPSPIKEKKPEDEVQRTGRLFGGLKKDLKHKFQYYASDFRDGLALQSIASIIFLYFATLTPIVAFGAVLGGYTQNQMAAMESILSGAVVGIIWALFAGQPLIIMGSTGPVLVFEGIVTTTCETYSLEYLPLRFWIGMWTGFFLLIMVATDASYLVRYITRFTEEGFAALISFIFIYESLEKLIAIKKTQNVCVHPMDCPRVYYAECLCNMTNKLIDVDGTNATQRWCLSAGGTLIGPGCRFTPDVLFFSVILFFATYFLASKLKGFRTEPFFPAKVRQIISDFSVTAAIILMSLTDYFLGLDTPKLNVPAGLTPTIHDRSWVVKPFGKNPAWTAFAAIVPAVFAVILIFMDQQITAVIINRQENKLKKGAGYHLDLLILSLAVIFCAVLGLPWMVAATVLSINHVNSLKLESECKAPGEAPQFESVRENRLTTLLIYVLIGASVFMTPVLSKIPMPVLYGVFLLMGVSALRGLQFVDRLSILFMPMKYQPDFMYLRHVPLRRVHLFTLIQTICLSLLWLLKSFDASSILFPIMVLALVGVRKLMDFIFQQKELALLDDLMPETKRRKKEDESLDADGSKTKAGSQSALKESKSGNHVTFPLPTGRIMRLPVSNSEGPGQQGNASVDSGQSAKKDDKSPLSQRWSKADKGIDPHAQVALFSRNNTVSVKPTHAQIPEENDGRAIPSPIITISPATPRGSRASNMDR